VATDQAVAATSQTIVKLLKDAFDLPGFPQADFKVCYAANLQAPPLSEGVSVFLYRMNINGSRRNAPARKDPKGRPPVWLDLHYLLTAWAKDPLKQQVLLAWAVRTLQDSPILPTHLLNDYSSGEIIFGPGETVELSAESLTLQDETNIWEVAKTQQQPSVGYLARMVAIESRSELKEPELAQTRVFEFREATQ